MSEFEFCFGSVPLRKIWTKLPYDRSNLIIIHTPVHRTQASRTGEKFV